MERNTCPECNKALHRGQHKFADGLYFVSYCKQCGYRREEPEIDATLPMHSKIMKK